MCNYSLKHCADNPEGLLSRKIYIYILTLLYVAFCMAISRQKKSQSRDYALLLFSITSIVLYSAQYHSQHYTLQSFEQFGALYMHNHDEKYPSRPGFEPGTSMLQAPVDTNEPSGPAIIRKDTITNNPVEIGKYVLQ